MGKSNRNLITRKKYNEVKRYDRQQMDMFLDSIYLTAYKDGYKEAVSNLSEKFISEEFKTALKNIKGFGIIKVDRIINIISQTIAQMKGEF